ISLRLPSQVIGFRTAVRVDGAPYRTPSSAVLRPVTRRYFETTGIPITVGRAFAAADRRTAPRVAIANAAFVRDVLAGAPALDVRLALELLSGTFSIVGVAADVTPGGEPDRPALYVSLDQIDAPGGSLLVRADGDLKAVMAALPARVKSVAPALARDRIYRVADDVGDQRAAARFNAQAVSSFAALALMLAIVGGYGLTAGDVADRGRERAVRMALGATRRDVIVAAIRPGAGAVGAGAVAGLGLAIAAGRAIASLLHGVAPADPGTFIGVLLTVIAA